MLLVFAIVLVAAITGAVMTWRWAKVRRRQLSDERISAIASSLGKKYAGQ
jgi:hypothetical protein